MGGYVPVDAAAAIGGRLYAPARGRFGRCLGSCNQTPALRIGSCIPTTHSSPPHAGFVRCDQRAGAAEALGGPAGKSRACAQ